MKKLIDKYVPAISLGCAVIALWASWFFSYPYFLRWLEGYSFFCTLPDFTRIHYDLPADLPMYAGSFLLQFYSWPAAGALIQAVIAVLFVICIWESIKRFFDCPESLIWVAFLPLPVFVYYQLSDLTLARALTWLMMAFAAMVLVMLLTVKKKRFIRLPRFMSNKVVSLAVSLLIVSVSAGFLIKGTDMTRGYEEVARLEYFGEHEEWGRILETVSKQDAVNNEYQRKYVLLALLNEGKLADYAFSYGLSDSEDFLFYNIQEPFCLGFNVLFYNSLDMYNPAIYNTYQEAVQSIPGLSFDTVRYLADVYLKLGDHALASKYLDLLSHSTCHRRWVKERLTLLESLKGKDATYPQSGPLFSLESFLPDISSMSDRYPYDRRYADLLLCGVLAEKDGSTFYNIFKVISRTQYPDGQQIPRLYQEALLLVASQNPEVLNRYKIDDEVWKRFADFTELMQKGQTSQAKRKYAGSYWAYVY
ncbi:MAG: hypothetical protein IJ971_02600 [Bacteroidales bacterium]|nr:hypothetical protein [Bacteroidales bacterium]